MKPIICVRGLSKQYQIATVQPPYQTLRESLTNAVRLPFRSKSGRMTHETIWALKDVDFEIQSGEVVGIIGRNGAGKSTLLKILSRVTEPTTGQVDLYGRIGSLLEVGTGFHPELTGRENVFLNGAILGMKRAEIQRKFDEIVAFSEIEKFIDTPVKFYSSGMYLRLAFSVSAHLEPEILILDEVLAVGDTDFQNKCFRKMQEITSDGTTILFVSHSMEAMKRLCKRAIFFENGVIANDGPADQVARTYLGGGVKLSAERVWPNLAEAPGNELARLLAVRVRSEEGALTEAVDVRQPFLIEIEYDILTPGKPFSPVIICNNEEGIPVFSSGGVSRQFLGSQDVNYTGRCVSACLVPGDFLAEGVLSVTVSINTLMDGNLTHALERDAVRFRVVDSLDENSARGLYGGPVVGVVRPLLTWTNKPIRTNSEGLSFSSDNGTAGR